MKNESQTIWSKIANSATVKAIVVGILILLMLIPVGMIRQLILEREMTSEAAACEVSSKWGNRQTLTGPVVVIPYKYNVTDNSVTREIRDYAYFLPEELDIETDIQPEIRYRSIYKVVVYQSKIKVNGSFKHPDFEKLSRRATSIDWENAFICIGLSDMRGIRSNIIFNWDNIQRETMSRVKDAKLVESGVTVKIPLRAEIDSDHTYHFDFALTLNGSHGLFFVPAGKTTQMAMTSPWNVPSFDGAFLPDQREIGPDGFKATWNIFNYNRNFPQMWTGDEYRLQSSEFGVNLLLSVDHYQKAMRSVKYAIIFIALTFLVFLLVELLSRKRIHPLQYLLVSIELVLFYGLLLALSEQMNFNLAYLLSALAIVVLITAYSHTIFKELKQTLFMGLFLAVLYMFLYTVLQLEDLALLIGSIGLFIALAVVMYVSRKVDWYHTQEDEVPQLNDDKEQVEG